MKKVEEETSEYEFCKLCRINHNQGRRHNFFPRHTNSLSSLLSRFHQKLSHVKSSLKNPSLVLPSQPSGDRLWCIFCDFDIDEPGSAIVSGTAIKHLASKDHLKNLKHFLWKYGGGMNKVDSFRITEADLAKWEKRCEALKKDSPSSSELFNGSSRGQSNDIQANYEIMNNFNKNNIHFLDTSSSDDVMPLLYATNENYQVYYPDISQASNDGSVISDVASSSNSTPGLALGTWNLPCHSGQQCFTSSATNSLADGLIKARVRQKHSIGGKEAITAAEQSLTRISNGGLVDIKQNVHSAALPPWLEGFEACNDKSRGPGVNSAQKNSRKNSKLNPKRVGAAWAEKRKLELEMEKRGEAVVNGSDDNWLPNFGRVWQSGSRKESMKEFKQEKLNVPIAEGQAESEIKLHPYISKRMRQETSNNADVQKPGDIF